MKLVRIFFIVILAYLFQQCATVPITGRKQLLIYPEGEIMQLSLTSYQDFLKENKLSTDAKNTARIKNIGKKRPSGRLFSYKKLRGRRRLKNTGPPGADDVTADL